jgi:hypothetical protein
MPKTKPAPAVQLSIGDLPEFEGIIPVGVVTKLKGASQRIHRPIHLGERGVALVEYESVDIGHKDTKDGVKRHQVLAVSEMYDIGSDRAAELLQEFRAAYRQADDARKGREPLFPDPDAPAGVEVKVDGSGVVVTPGDEQDDWEGDRAAFDELEAARAKRRAEEAGGVPFDGYENLGARQVVAYIKRQSSREHVLAIGEWEESNANRPSVVSAVTKRSAELA